MPDPKQIAVVTPAGDVRTIASTDAADAAEQGFELATPEQVKGAKNQAKFDEASALGKAGYVAGAAGAGALRGLSAGLSDAVLVHGAGLLGKDSATATRETLNELRDVAPTASLLGEGAGMIGGLALGSGEVGVGGKALTAVSRAGAMAERGAARLLGEGATSLAGRVAQRGLATAASGAVEGALYGAGSTISEAALGDETLTGEKLVAGMGHGALVGGALGAAFGGVSGAFSRGRSKLADVVAEREGAAAARMGGDVAEGSLKARFGEWAQDQADINLLKGLGLNKSKMEQIERLAPGGRSRVSRLLADDIERSTGKTLGVHGTEEINALAERRLGELERSKLASIKSLDAAKAAAPLPEVLDKRAFDELVVKNIPEAMREEFRGKVAISGATMNEVPVLPLAKDSVKPVIDLMSEVRDSLGKGTTFKDWYEARKLIDGKINFAKTNASPALENMRAYRAIFEDEFEKAGEAAAAAKGESFAQQWKADKALQQAYIYAKEGTGNKLAAQAANNSFSLGPTIASIANTAAFGAPAGIASAVLGRIAKERGDMISADLWRRASGLSGVQHAVARVDSQVNNGVQKLLGSAAPKSAIPKLPTYGAADPIRSAATYAATRKTERENYYAEANDIRMSAARPGALTERIAENLAPYAGSAPKAVAAASATAVRGVTFLASKLPPSGIDPTSLTPQLEKPDRMTSDIAITKWMKYKRAVDNPLSVLSDAKSGKLTPEAVEAVKFVYPKIYEQLCDTVIRATVDAKRPLTYQESIRVGILLDRPTDWSMTPSAQKVIQSTYALPQQPPNRVSSGGKKINLASTYETTTTRVMSR